MKRILSVIAVLMLFAAPAMAGFLNDNTLALQSGTTNNWLLDAKDTGGNFIKLFKPPTSHSSGSPPPSGLWGQNNDSPVPYSVGYVPSPGVNDGEKFDIEAVFFAYTALTDNLQVWCITSIGPNGSAYGGAQYHLGDVFIDVGADGGGTYDYALLSFGTKPGLTAQNPVYDDKSTTTNNWQTSNSRDAGELVTLSGSADNLYEINGPSSYNDNNPGYDTTIETMVNPWAVNTPQTVTTTGVLKWQEITDSDLEDLDNAGAPLPTYVYYWEATISGLESYMADWEEDMLFHVTVQCGNDESPGNGVDPGGGGRIPAPGALILGVIGAGLVGLRRRMRG